MGLLDDFALWWFLRWECWCDDHGHRFCRWLRYVPFLAWAGRRIAS